MEKIKKLYSRRFPTPDALTEFVNNSECEVVQIVMEEGVSFVLFYYLWRFIICEE